MNADEWKELAEIDHKKHKRRYDYLLALSATQDEHPESHDGPCMCALCRSYG